MHRDEVPTSAREIMDRINEISFNSSLLHEMRSIQFVTRLIDSGALDNTRYKRMNMHMIEAEDELKHFGAASKFNTDMAFLSHLRDIGRTAADNWLRENFDAIGKRSTLDIAAKFL
jgi:NTE family protein